MRPVVTLMIGKKRFVAVGSETFGFHKGKPKAVSDEIARVCDRINQKSGMLVFAIAGGILKEERPAATTKSVSQNVPVEYIFEQAVFDECPL